VVLAHSMYLLIWYLRYMSGCYFLKKGCSLQLVIFVT